MSASSRGGFARFSQLLRAPAGPGRTRSLAERWTARQGGAGPGGAPRAISCDP
ncbi:MAG: hypothetical protein LBE67_10035 [Kocuria palustris]|nr:hypothetical protein [Kocuria palustris]